MATSHDKKLELTVKSTSGQFSDEFNAENKAQKVLDEAVRRLGLNTGGGVTYVLRREADGRTLDLSEKLGDLGVLTGDVLLIQTSQAQDG